MTGPTAHTQKVPKKDCSEVSSVLAGIAPCTYSFGRETSPERPIYISVLSILS